MLLQPCSSSRKTACSLGIAATISRTRRTQDATSACAAAWSEPSGTPTRSTKPNPSIQLSDRITAFTSPTTLRQRIRRYSLRRENEGSFGSRVRSGRGPLGRSLTRDPRGVSVLARPQALEDVRSSPPRLQVAEGAFLRLSASLLRLAP